MDNNTKTNGTFPIKVDTVDDAINILGKAFLAKESKTQIINPEKIKAMALAYAILSNVYNGTDVKVENRNSNMLRSVGCISLTGKNVFVNNPEQFAEICKLASNVDIYPKSNGTMQVDFTFNGITTMVK